MITLHGITWKNPRGYDPLVAAAAAYRAEHPQVRITWEQRPWYEFESNILESLRTGDGRYDLIMFDHPWVGKLARERWLLPWDTLVSRDYVDALRGRVVWPSVESYEYEGHVWALPLDAACHAGLYRADVVQAHDLPTQWEEVEPFARAHHQPPHRYGLALSVEGVLGNCLFLSMMAGLGCPPFVDEANPTCDRQAADYVLTLLKRLVAYTPPGSTHWGPWDIYERLCSRDEVAYSPSIFAYVNYFHGVSVRGDHLRLTCAPALAATGTARPILGGVGLGIAHSCREIDAAVDYGKFLMSDAVQRDVFPAHCGQPGAAVAWHDTAINQRFNNFYADLLPNMQAAYTRPRYPAFHELELANGRILQDLWDDRADLNTTLDRLRAV